MKTLWKVRLGRQAEQDFSEILQWTVRNFSEVQAGIYAETLSLAMQALADGPEIPGTQARDEIRPGIRTLHVARHGRKGRHFIVFRVGNGRRTIDILRLLHDRMDLKRHFPAAEASRKPHSG